MVGCFKIVVNHTKWNWVACCLVSYSFKVTPRATSVKCEERPSCLQMFSALLFIISYLMHPIYFSVRFLFWSEKNETALSRVELRWYQLSLLIKSQVHLAQRGRENWLQTRFIMAAKDGGTVFSLPTSILFEISSKDMQGYSGGVEIQFLEWEATSISSYKILDLSHCLLLWQEYKKLNLVRPKSLVLLIIQYYESANLAFKV